MLLFLKGCTKSCWKYPLLQNNLFICWSNLDSIPSANAKSTSVTGVRKGRERRFWVPMREKREGRTRRAGIDMFFFDWPIRILILSCWMFITWKTMASFSRRFPPSLPPCAPLAFLSRQKSPFPSPSNALLPRRLMPKLKGSPEWGWIEVIYNMKQLIIILFLHVL